MARIYISSTYQDLKDHREEVYRALRNLSQDVIAMEDYLATDTRPLDKCLKDVARCEIYVGIFAWRYGFTPLGQSKAITELEYREAKRLGLKCLIFLLDETVPWPPLLIDEDAAKIKALREELMLEHTISKFSSRQGLALSVSSAVSNELIGHQPPPVPATTAAPALPGESVYLMCDRQLQKDDFQLLYGRTSAAKLLAFAIPGRRCDMPESLVERFFVETQSRTKGAAEGAGLLHDVGWPAPGRKTRAERQQLLLLNLRERAEVESENDIPDEKDIASHFSTSLVKVHFLRHRIDLGRWQEDGEGELMSWYLDFWQKVAAQLDKVRVVLFFNLIIPEAGRWSFFGGSKRSGQIPAEAQALFGKKREKFLLRLLDPLPPCIKTEDLEEWMQEHRLVPEHDRKQKSQELMDEAGSCPPMEVIQGRLKRFCDSLNRVRQGVSV
ncbi:MAG: DUF4062 domain-containing protein [Blastocatellia bacterium]